MRHVLDSDTPFHGRLLPTPPVPFYPPPSLELDPSSLSIADRYHSVIGKPINANIIICLGVQSPGLHILSPQCLSSGPHSSLQVMASSPFPRPLGQVTCTPSRWAMPSCMLSTPLDPVLSLSYQSWPPDRQLCTVPATPRPTRSWQSPGSNVLQLVVHLAGLGSVPFFGRLSLYPHTVFIFPIPACRAFLSGSQGLVATCPSLGLFLHLPHESTGATEQGKRN